MVRNFKLSYGSDASTASGAAHTYEPSEATLAPDGQTGADLQAPIQPGEPRPAGHDWANETDVSYEYDEEEALREF